MTASQNFVPIEDIRDDLIFLKNGNVALILSTSALNFALLFETEQASIIESFAGLLNSLSFPIQITILSRRLDVTSYLTTLDRAALIQTNPKLQSYTAHFRRFVESIIKENNVLDKQFYVAISCGSAELGVLPKNQAEKYKRAATILAPRRDHLIKQLGRLGILAKQLKTAELIKLFYTLYNPEPKVQIQPIIMQPAKSTTAINPPLTRLYPQPQPVLLKTPLPPPVIQTPVILPQPIISSLSPPYVVEELPDD